MLNAAYTRICSVLKPASIVPAALLLVVCSRASIPQRKSNTETGFAPSTVVIDPKGTIGPGATFTATVQSRRPARGGEVVSISLRPHPEPKGGTGKRATKAQAIRSAPLAAGTRSVKIKLTAPSVKPSGEFVVRATATGSKKEATVRITVVAMALRPVGTGIGSISFPQTLVSANQTVTGTISSTVPAGATITLTSSDTSVATVPATVQAPSDGTSPTFTVTTVGTGTASITASWDGGFARGSITVQ